jgi:hypothetical protein
MSDIPKSPEHFLASWRQVLPDHEVRTQWSEDHRCWVCTHRLNGTDQMTEMLDVIDPTDHEAALLAELGAVNVCAPLIAANRSQCNGSPRVFPDEEGYWSSWHPCNSCGGFPWRLRLHVGTFGASEMGQAIERELARLLAHREVFLHGTARPESECVGCLEREIAEGGSTQFGDEFAWFSSDLQQWHIRLKVNEETTADLPLGLAPWASTQEVRSEIRRVASLGRDDAPPPYDWQEEGEF